MICETLTQCRRDPFPHTAARELIGADVAESVLRWMENAAPWTLKVANFYEQWELHLDRSVLPPNLNCLVAKSTIDSLTRTMLCPLTEAPLELVEVTAHKLVPGQTIRIHNDFIADQESHRLLIQLNRGWSEVQGGVLMLFGSSEPDDIRRALKPDHRSSFAFEISPRSFHAVSTIADGERFTIVYSFKMSSVGGIAN
jgi:Rps23 Pro-64 3,4-dihydroxylase Tpa1-like proline 4-hydroxylase